MKKFAVFDIDGTLIRWQLYHAIADTLARAGHLDKQTYAVIKDARMLWKKRIKSESFDKYQTRLIQAYEQLLPKLSFVDFEKAVNSVFEEYKDQVYTYTRDLIEELKEKDYILLAISRSQTEIIAKVAKYYGFNDWVGANYEKNINGFSGRPPVLLPKKDILKELVKKHSLSFDASVAVGDSESDTPMLEAVEVPVAFNPTKKLFDHAKQNGWKIVVERKNVVYEMEKEGEQYILAEAKPR